MSEFKTNEKYDHKKEYVSDCLNISDERKEYLVDLVPENLGESEFLDFVEQQDWTIIEKLYIVDHFNFSNYQEEVEKLKSVIEGLTDIVVNLQQEHFYYRRIIENSGHKLQLVVHEKEE